MTIDKPEWQKPSKTQLKNEMLERQNIGEKLIQLTPAQLDNIPLSSHLREQIDIARNLTAHGALRRQKQYIGRLMREVDIEPIKVELEKLQKVHFERTLIFQQAERWRDKLLMQGNNAITEFINAYPTLDIQLLRQLIRQAQDDNKQKTGASKKLFRYLIQVLEIK